VDIVFFVLCELCEWVSHLLVDPEVLKQAELMEKRREEERLRIEAMDSKLGFKKTVGFSATQYVRLTIVSFDSADP
jgi:hypothetical protein